MAGGRGAEERALLGRECAHGAFRRAARHLDVACRARSQETPADRLRERGREHGVRVADRLRRERHGRALLASLYATSVTSRIATGSRTGTGQRVLRVGDRIEADDLPVLLGERCASVGGVSVRANVAVPARDRRRLERLCGYEARPPVATERLSRLEDGRLIYRLKHRWRDGTTQAVLTPSELVEKHAALVPPPCFHLVRHGVLGPCASERDRIVPAWEGAHPPETTAAIPACMGLPVRAQPLAPALEGEAADPAPTDFES